MVLSFTPTLELIRGELKPLLVEALPSTVTLRIVPTGTSSVNGEDSEKFFETHALPSQYLQYSAVVMVMLLEEVWGVLVKVTVAIFVSAPALIPSIAVAISSSVISAVSPVFPRMALAMAFSLSVSAILDRPDLGIN